MLSSDLQTRLAALLQTAQLPSLPHSAARLLDMSQDPQNGPAELAIPIESDLGLSSQILQLANSPCFGSMREIASIPVAIAHVGIRKLQQFVLWQAIFSSNTHASWSALEMGSLRMDALRRALFARLIARRLQLPNADDYFAASLLQDVAVPLLANRLADSYERLLHVRRSGRQRLSQLEQQAFGWTHADAAAWLARQWRLPESMAELVESHIHLRGSLPGDLVALSALLPADVDRNWLERERLEAAYAPYASLIGQSLADVLAEVDLLVAELRPVLGLPHPVRSLLERWRAPARAQ